MSKYTGSDASTKAKAKMDTIKTWASSSTWSNDQVVSDLVSNAQIITTMSASDAQTIAPKAVAALESSTVDTTDSLSTKNYLGKLDATSNVVSKGGLSSTDLSKMTNILQNVLGGNTSTVSSSSKTGSTGSTSSSSSSSSTSTSVTSTNVKDRIPTKGTESVNQLSKSDSKMMMNTISKLTDGITNNKNLITALDFENYKKDIFDYYG